jgi:cell division septum initiation protein DivIVA
MSFFDPDLNFRTRPFGYDKEDVRTCLHNMQLDHEEALKRIAQLTEQLKATRGAAEPVGVRGNDPAPRPETGAKQAERLLVAAQRVADEVRSEAEAAARDTLRGAQEEAAQLRSQAEADASALATTAKARLAEIEAEIVAMQGRRDAVQKVLLAGADRLNEIAIEIRQAAVGDATRHPGAEKKPADGTPAAFEEFA